MGADKHPVRHSADRRRSEAVRVEALARLQTSTKWRFSLSLSEISVIPPPGSPVVSQNMKRGLERISSGVLEIGDHELRSIIRSIERGDRYCSIYVWRKRCGVLAQNFSKSRPLISLNRLLRFREEQSAAPSY